jgi:aminomethyltransferase
LNQFQSEPLKTTPLHALHKALGARMVPFAGYDMPVQYPSGILKEHEQCRSKAALFDVSHMGQAVLRGANVDEALETLVPADIKGLAVDRMRYTQFTNDAGGILDDLMVTRRADRFFLVVNAARKDHDFAHLRKHLAPRGCVLQVLVDRALLALQGPAAAAVMARLAPEAAALGFMSGANLRLADVPVFVSRSGYTGEDGFELSIPAVAAADLARRLLEQPEVAPAGLGARDSLRLEAGLCLYGHDIDETTSPIEAGLAWSIAPRRREGGGFPGAARIQRELREGVARKRVGLRPEGRVPAREGTEITDAEGKPVGKVTSGGFGATAGGPVAMGYVAPAAAKPGTRVNFVIRGEARPGTVVKLPFVPHRYAKG